MWETELRVERIVWGDPRFQAAKEAEFQIFGLENQFTSAEDLAAGEMLVYSEYERTSEFYIAYDLRSGSADPVAVIRFVRFNCQRGSQSFSTLRDGYSYSIEGRPAECYIDQHWKGFFDTADLSQVGEIASEAVTKSYRCRGAIDYLWDAMMEVSNDAGLTMWIMAPVVYLLQWYKKVFPNAVHQIGRMMPQYVGADSIPAMVRLDDPALLNYQRQFRSRHGTSQEKPRIGVAENGQ